MTFKEKIVKLRKLKGITQDELASAVGVSRQAVYKWESGQSYPEVPKLIEMKLLFGISIDDLLDETYEVILPEKKRRRRLTEEEKKAREEKARREEEEKAAAYRASYQRVIAPTPVVAEEKPAAPKAEVKVAAPAAPKAEAPKAATPVVPKAPATEAPKVVEVTEKAKAAQAILDEAADADAKKKGGFFARFLGRK